MKYTQNSHFYMVSKHAVLSSNYVAIPLILKVKNPHGLNLLRSMYPHKREVLE